MKSITCKKHWLYSRKTIILLIFFVFLISFLIKEHDFSGVLLIMGFFAIVYGIGYMLSRSEYLALSDGMITGHRGIIKSQTLKSPISKVQDVSVSNGLLGKVFGYSTITVNTAGSNGAEYVFRNMTNAKQFQNAFVRAANSLE